MREKIEIMKMLIYVHFRKQLVTKGVRKGGIVKKFKKGPLPAKKIGGGKVTDARFKIISKNRRTIRDAREKILETHRTTIKDARELLTTKKKAQPAALKRGGRVSIPRSRMGHLSMDEDMLIDEDDLALLDLDQLKTKPLGSLKRTVKNDIYRTRTTPPRMPKLPSFSISNRETSPLDDMDPFDCYTVPSRRIIPPPPLPRAERFHPARGMMSAHMDEYFAPRKGILRGTGSNDHDDRFESDRYISSEPRSARHGANDSAGIFANSMRRPSPPPLSNHGTRVIVSNLDEAISAEEIGELFEDLGNLVSYRLVRPGTAEVVYQDTGDAERAVEAYHNRQLDKRPMKVHIAQNEVIQRYRM